MAKVVVTWVCYNRVDFCSKLVVGTQEFVRYNPVFVITEFQSTNKKLLKFLFRTKVLLNYNFDLSVT